MARIIDTGKVLLSDQEMREATKRIADTSLKLNLKEFREMIPDDETAAGEVHPAPVEFSEEAIQLDPILRFFHYAHLPPALQARSQPFCALAMHLVDTTPRNAERTVALRKLLEAKDAAVRASV